ncbi:phosphotransferase enzyme family protein [Denitrobacterium detoxificans]|jgi:Ser/Thr protein kinase RdoA (MazF antagonist)|uniref:phosphotransferase enzyme family protein n=1 Tax=Denitrobacterium detoxificans TaxID=79604 RepID=UPI0026EC6E09|nr:phosphotransferase [Denitrobacterium detoxificans]MBE6465744.1 serine kinase [Denitrobacterium detoxificans]
MANNFENPELFQQVAAVAARRYPFERSDAKLLAFSENATYLIFDPETNERLCVMRVGRPGYHTLEEYESEIAWLRQINDYTPLKVANPIPADDGSYIQQVELESTTYYCVATEFLTGTTLEQDDNPAAAPQHFEMLGEVTAYLHRQTEIWNGTKDIKRFHWDTENMIGENAIWGDWHAYPDMTDEEVAKIEQCCEIIKRRLDRYGKTPQNYGVIHADLRDTNILVEGDTIKVIDFDDFGFGWHVHDLASALTFIEERDEVPDLVNAWLTGYRKVLPFTDTDFVEIDTFILQRRIQMLAWMASHQDSTPVQGYMQGYMEGTMGLVDRYLRLFG